MTEIVGPLTEREQIEIRQYIAARITGGTIRPTELPAWLLDLEHARVKVQELKVENRKLLDALWLAYDLYNLPLMDFKKLHPVEYALAVQDERHVWEIVRRALPGKDGEK